MTLKRLGKLSGKALPALALMLALVLSVSGAEAQACNDGYPFCTMYGIDCQPGKCDPTAIGNVCCDYSCVKPAPGGGGGPGGEQMT